MTGEYFRNGPSYHFESLHFMLGNYNVCLSHIDQMAKWIISIYMSKITELTRLCGIQW